MSDILDKKKIRKVFRNVQKHLSIAQLIRRFSTNKEDIRKAALNRVNLSRCRSVLELGCAFGAFTEALKNKLHDGATITGVDIIAEYKPFFLDACRRAGYEGTFLSSGIEKIKKIPSGSFDLVICSYALYFFPEIIPEIARIMKPSGFFITITHSSNDMREIVEIVKKILGRHHASGTNRSLPIEIIFDQFSAENGESLLQPFFKTIEAIDFKNTLVFQPQEIKYFMDYFQFKKSFFLSVKDANNQTIIRQLFKELQETLSKNQMVSMCKDDRIFICSQPSTGKDSP